MGFWGVLLDVKCVGVSSFEFKVGLAWFWGSKDPAPTSKHLPLVRIGFWGPLYYIHNKEPPNSIGKYLGPYINPLDPAVQIRFGPLNL